MNDEKRKPLLLVIAGPNGSGKSTITEYFETVLSSQYKMEILRKAKECGYFIKCVFVLTVDFREMLR